MLNFSRGWRIPEIILIKMQVEVYYFGKITEKKKEKHFENRNINAFVIPWNKLLIS